MRHSQLAHLAEIKELRVAKKRAIRSISQDVPEMAVERLKGCDNIVALSQEAGCASATVPQMARTRSGTQY